MQRALMFGILTAALAGTVAGCGAGKTWTFNKKVEGTLVLDGTPLAGVVVQFVPEDPKYQGPTSRGYTNETGHFRLKADGRKTGAVIGRHSVIVLTGRGADTQGGEETDGNAEAIAKARRKNPPIPTPYRTVRETPLSVDVTEDKHEYELTLTRSASPRPVK